METFKYMETYKPVTGFYRYASATLIRSTNRLYWRYEQYKMNWVMDDFGYLIFVGYF